MLAKWIPPNERSRMGAAVYAGKISIQTSFALHNIFYKPFPKIFLHRNNLGRWNQLWFTQIHRNRLQLRNLPSSGLHYYNIASRLFSRKVSQYCIDAHQSLQVLQEKVSRKTKLLRIKIIIHLHSFPGAQFGTVISMPLSGLLSAYGFSGGWPSIFYVFGLVGTVWCLAFLFFVSEDPEQCPSIKEAEKKYILSSLWGAAGSSVSIFSEQIFLGH